MPRTGTGTGTGDENGDGGNGPRARQATARRARHRLLEAACRRRGILHLLLAHTADDQAETVLLRLSRGSGPEGTAGIPALAERPGLRLLRPLLDRPKASLVALCREAAVAVATDPSNADPAYARGRLRRVQPLLAAEGLGLASLGQVARRAAPARRRLEAAAAALLAEAAAIFPEGYASLAAGPWRAAAADARLAVLAGLVRAVGGRDYAPRLAALQRLERRLAEGRSATLGGCRVLVDSACDRLLLAREAAGIAERTGVRPGESLLFDRRLWVTVPPALRPGSGPLRLAPLGRQAGRVLPSAAGPAVPAPARAALPGLWTEEGRLVAAPAVPARHPARLAPGVPDRLTVAFRPPGPIAAAGFVDIGGVV